MIKILSWYAALCTRAYLITTHPCHRVLGPTSMWMEWGLNPLKPQPPSSQHVKVLFSQLALFAGWREVRNRSAAAIHTELPMIPILCCRGLGVGSSSWVAPGPKGSTPSGTATVTRRVNCAHILTEVGDWRGAQPFLHGPANPPLTTNSDYLGKSPPLAPPRGHRAQVHGHLGT